MSRANRTLPDFDNPPVVEVIASVQFEALPIPTAWIGRWWDQIKDHFPHVEDKPPIEGRVEDFGPPKSPQVQVRILTGPPNVRAWFSNEPDGVELLQIQQDRLVYNWRGHDGGQPYPRYQFVRDRFASLYSEYERFLDVNGLGRIEPTQCELTYINHINVGQGWKDPQDWTKVFKFWKNLTFAQSNLELEQVSSRLTYKIMNESGEPIGRLHVVAEQRRFITTDEPLLYLELAARGAPMEEGSAGVLRFIDIAHEEIVSGFDAMTETTMHQLWRKANA
jgi:uncharacterized protein (TIGR04255 family)